MNRGYRATCFWKGLTGNLYQIHYILRLNRRQFRLGLLTQTIQRTLDTAYIHWS